MSIQLKRWAPVATVALLAALVAAVVLQRNMGATPPGLVYANGRLESDRIAVASKVSGRVVSMIKQEGDPVTAGEVLARLDDKPLRLKRDEAQAAVAALEAQLAATLANIDVARREAPLGVAALAAQRDRAAALALQTKRDADRFANLRQEGVIDAHHAEEAQLTATSAAAQLDQADRQLANARLAADKVAASQTGSKAIVAQLAAAHAQLEEAQTALDETEIKAPLNGVVAIRAREPGEVVGAGGTLYELYNPAQLYLRAYVPETEIGLLRLGLPARVWVDAYPGRPFEARLTTIANRAEFTPKEVQTRDERAKQVFGIKLLLKPQPDTRLAPGLPGDATIRYREGVAWRAPR